MSQRPPIEACKSTYYPNKWYAVSRSGRLAFVDKDGYLTHYPSPDNGGFFDTKEEAEVALATAALRGYQMEPST